MRHACLVGIKYGWRAYMFFGYVLCCTRYLYECWDDMFFYIDEMFDCRAELAPARCVKTQNLVAVDILCFSFWILRGIFRWASGHCSGDPRPSSATVWLDAWVIQVEHHSSFHFNPRLMYLPISICASPTSG